MTTTLPTREDWINALRSGEYKQVSRYLKKEDKFCCLGVYCDLVDSSRWREGGNYYDLTGLDVEWSRAVINIPIEWERYLAVDQNLLMRLNDQGATFDQIADMIEYYDPNYVKVITIDGVETILYQKDPETLITIGRFVNKSFIYNKV